MKVRTSVLLSALLMLPCAHGETLRYSTPGPGGSLGGGLSAPVVPDGYCRTSLETRVRHLFDYGPQMFMLSALFCPTIEKIQVNGERWLVQSGRWYPASSLWFASPHGRW
ncbi:hypothetical protein [Entomohabitans teleogrylli]|uniref:hypothetical protein n=1 Tax=Entomohabitans teleogrylli TaxID=1384589 RepID=UPI00073D4611|nr:hypothetical protein [Entomohabitans teleogrylli]